MIENTFVVFTYAIKMFRMKKSIKVSLYSILLFLVLFGLASVFWLADLRTSQIKNGTQIQWVSLDDILYLEAARAYVTIHLAEGSMVLRQSMGNLLAHFEERDMLRIHRSFAVNPRKVEGVSSAKVVISGKKLPLGPGYREEFLEWMRAV